MGIDQQPKDVGTARGRPKGATRKRRINPPVSALPLCKAKEVVAKMERVMGIEPTFEAWEAPVLPLNYTRERAGIVL